jgi:hypothetical protein
MSIYEYAPGRFVVQKYRADPLGGKPHRLCKRLQGRDAAEKLEQKFDAQLDTWEEGRALIKKARESGLQIALPSTPPSMPDFPTYLEERYLPWYRENRGQRTLRARASAIMTVAEDLAGIPLDKVEHRIDELVERWRKEGCRYRVERDRLGRKQKRQPRPITEAGINERLRAARAVLNHAYKRTRILNVPPRIQLLTVKGATPGSERPVRYFTPQERVQFLKYAERDVADTLEVGRMLGLRPAELFHAQVGWVDFQKRKVWVQACACALCPDGKWIPKTGTFRGVDICPDLLPILRRLTKGRRDEALLIANTHGAPLSRLEGSGGRFVRTLRRAGLARKGLSLYSCRHTFAADLVTAGVSMKKVATLLGNGVRVCEMHYGHLIPGHTAEAVKVLKAVQPWPAGKPPSPARAADRVRRRQNGGLIDVRHLHRERRPLPRTRVLTAT